MAKSNTKAATKAAAPKKAPVKKAPVKKEQPNSSTEAERIEKLREDTEKVGKSEKKVASGKLATIEDFKSGLAYFVETEGGRIEVQPSGNLAADAVKFQHHVGRGEAFLGATADKAKLNKTAFQKTHREEVKNEGYLKSEPQTAEALPPVRGIGY